MTQTATGRIVEVSTVPVGDVVLETVLTGATEIPLNSTVDFNLRDGLPLQATCVDPTDDDVMLLFDVTAVDHDTDTLTVATGPTVDLPEGHPFYVYPTGDERVAQVLLDEGDDEPIPCRVPHGLYDRVPEGIREPGAEEAVAISEDDDGEWVVVDVLGVVPDLILATRRLRAFVGLPQEEPGFLGFSRLGTERGSMTLRPAFADTGSARVPFLALQSGTSVGEGVAVLNAPDEVVLDSTLVTVTGGGVVNGSHHADDVYSDSQTGVGTIGASLTSQGRLIRTPSTRRVKKNIKPMSAATAQKVLALEPVTFQLKAEDDGPTYPGFIAEQAAEAGADLWVSRDGHGEPTGIRYPELTAALVSIVRDQAARLTELEAKVAALTKDKPKK